MGLLSRSREKRTKLLDKLTEDNKQYIDHVSNKRKKVIKEGIGLQRKAVLSLLKPKQKPRKHVSVKTHRPKVTKKPTVKRTKHHISTIKKARHIKPIHKPIIKRTSHIKPIHQIKKPQIAKLQHVKKHLVQVKRSKSPTIKKPDIKTNIPESIDILKTESAIDVRGIAAEIEQELVVPSVKGNYVNTGIEGFDRLLVQGIPKSSSLLVAGGAGSGKTIFCLQMLNYQASKGKKCLYMSFEEKEDRLIHHMADFGWDAKKLMKQNKLKLMRMNPFDITRNVDAMLAQQKGELLIDVDPVIIPSDYKPDFIVIDSLTAIASAFTGKQENYRIYIEQLFRFFEKIGATSFLITETEQVPKIFSQTGVEEFLADGVIVLYNIKRGSIRENALEILKLRGAAHKKRIVAYEMGRQGIIVYPEQQIFGDIE